MGFIWCEYGVETGLQRYIGFLILYLSMAVPWELCQGFDLRNSTEHRHGQAGPTPWFMQPPKNCQRFFGFRVEGLGFRV